MTEVRLRVNVNGRVVLPAAFRKALDIRPGDQLVARLEGDEVRITTLARRIERVQRRLRQYVRPGISLADELVAERRAAARHE